MTEPRVVLAEEAPRAELVRYLATFEGDTRGEAGWAARLRRFWDENPTPGPWGSTRSRSCERRGSARRR